MLAKTIDDCQSRPSVSWTRFVDGVYIPTFTQESVRVIEGRAVIAAEHQFEREQLLQSLRCTHRHTLRMLFHTLSPPPMDSLAGEYDAELLDQGGPINQLLMGRVFGMHGSWTGKAFHPVNENTGVGYNCFELGGTAVRKLPMSTTIETSTFDDRPSFKISYKGKNRGLISFLNGEVRQVTSSIMLGFGIFGPRLGQRDVSRRKIPFILMGPCRPYHDDLSDHLRSP